MIPIKFKINKKDFFRVCPKYISNGHWLVSREAVKGNREFKDVWNSIPGTYPSGLAYWASGVPTGYLEKYIPDLKGYKKAVPTSEAKIDGNGNLFAINIGGVWIAPEYFRLLDLGDEIMIRDKMSPIIVRRSHDIVAVIMPVRV